MSRWDPKRWVQLPDGSYRLRAYVDPSGGQMVPDVLLDEQSPVGPTYRELAEALSTKPAYATMTRARLIAESERRGIAKYGTKDVLIARLEKDDG